MPQYTIERVDISTCEVQADSPDEALALANAWPEIWGFEAGENTVILENKQ